ncbi:NAD(P)/FAD-dependent oxidoreductase [Calothrix sp. 336/3]|uniref:NAD(P)/FAD-dependent oxidoreductase n=1 Tax=Calothrix sp. 336/3 TaxID=1337936 RepID=UPI0004E2F089|nr:FAD-dependent oxidoreductase [Calothrix sp. 336/3]AKG22567.1 FAD-dependent oxidoreductase [Calothrix sp. 336/3]
MTDIIIIGAGMAGLICAQQLQQAGYSVQVIEKSRGLGGRMATRRLHQTWADHGASYIKPQDKLLQDLVDLLCQQQILEVWTDIVHEFPNGVSSPAPRYTAPLGMSAIAKFLSHNLDIRLNQRVTHITLTSQGNWQITTEANDTFISTKAVIFAIPAPQILPILQPLQTDLLGMDFWHHLSSVDFYPSISVMAGYSSQSQPLPDWKAMKFSQDNTLAWIGLDSSKRPQPQQPHFVIQSSVDFAKTYLDALDLQPVGQKILSYAANKLQLPWLNHPEWMQVHRWRYAFPKHPWQNSCLSAATPSPLICCGDWCGGNLIEAAFLSGIAAAATVNQELEKYPLSDNAFLDYLYLLTD